MGMGSMGRFIAHALRGIPNPPPVTLIFHGSNVLKQWTDSPQRLQLVTDGSTERREDYEAELAHLRPRLHGKEIGASELLEGESREPIHSLILCRSSTKVLQALSAVRHRLHRDSVILFMHSGLGVIEKVNNEIFPDPQTRPRYMFGVNTHEIAPHASDRFTSVHASFGTMALGLLPHERDGHAGPYSPVPRFTPFGHTAHLKFDPSQAPRDPNLPPPQPPTFQWTPYDRYLLRTLLRTPVLCATGFSPPDLLQLQLEKLAVTSIIGPLTVLLDARNGALLYNYALTRTIRLLLSETSLVLRSLPELAYIPNVSARFDPGRLETMVFGLANKTRDTVSRMLEDVRGGKETDVEYVNGWIVKRGEELGVRCFMNYMMVQMVKGKGNMVQMEMSEGVPFVGGGERVEMEMEMRGVQREDV